jgi:hypothetical protein
MQPDQRPLLKLDLKENNYSRWMDGSADHSDSWPERVPPRRRDLGGRPFAHDYQREYSLAAAGLESLILREEGRGERRGREGWTVTPLIGPPSSCSGKSSGRLSRCRNKGGSLAFFWGPLAAVGFNADSCAAVCRRDTDCGAFGERALGAVGLLKSCGIPPASEVLDSLDASTRPTSALLITSG